MISCKSKRIFKCTMQRDMGNVAHCLGQHTHSHRHQLYFIFCCLNAYLIAESWTCCRVTFLLLKAYIVFDHCILSSPNRGYFELLEICKSLMHLSKKVNLFICHKGIMKTDKSIKSWKGGSPRGHSHKNSHCKYISWYPHSTPLQVTIQWP